MTETELRTESDKYNAQTAKTLGYQEIINSAHNWAPIMRFFKEGRARDLCTEPKKLNEPCILTSSGPSLDNTIGLLKDWKYGIICHYSQAVSLMYYGIEPDYIVLLDAACNWDGLKDINWSKTKTKIILDPGIWHDIVENWPNEMLFYRRNLGKADTFGVNEQKIMYSESLGTMEDILASRFCFKSLINTEILQFACTPPAQMIISRILEYGPLFLTGFDFAYTPTKERFTDWYKDGDKWVCNEHLFKNDHEYIKTSNGLNTDPLHMYYKKNFISACRLAHPRIYTTDKAALTEIPYIDMEYIIKNQGKSLKKYDVTQEIRDMTYDKYLATIGCFCLEEGSKATFVEAKNPGVDLISYMQEANKKYICEQCSNNFIINDAIDHTGHECIICKTKSLKRISNFDIEKNMKRIGYLLKYVEECK